MSKSRGAQGKSLYTEEERRRRDASPWTMVQGVLAPLQFIVFLVSLGLVLHYLATGSGYEAATISIVVKTLLLVLMAMIGMASLDTVMRSRQVVGFQNMAQTALYAADAGVAITTSAARAP